MTDCQNRLDELTHAADVVLSQDLAALQKMPEHSRIERYNEIKANEEELLWEFPKDCPNFLTGPERDHLQGELRLARLLLAASFHDNGQVPRALRGDFIEAELEAVVDFDRYKQFDVLSEDQIEERVRRMEGEVYELVTEYTSTQIANVDELVDNPDVQQDVITRLVDRYDERREKIRQGFFVYVETHGLEHMVGAIEDAVSAVAEASQTREEVRDALREEMDALSESLEQDVRTRHQSIEAQLQSLEHQLSSETVSRRELHAEFERLEQEQASVTTAQAEALEELTERIEKTTKLEERLDEKIDELAHIRERAAHSEREAAREEATTVVENELETLGEQRRQLEQQIGRLQREREQIERARERVDEWQTDVESRLSDIETSVDTSGGGLEGENVVTTTVARLLEMDYVGRVDTSVHDADEIYTPDGPFEVPDGYWEGRSEHRSDRSRLARLLDDGEDPERYPVNRSVRYEVTSSQYLGLSREREMTIEAATLSNLDAHATNGFDARPSDLDDLLSLVNQVVYEAEVNEGHYLLAVASPTGWTDRVLEQIEHDRGARTRFSRNVSLVLVDLQDGSLFFDPTDDVVTENRPLFEIPVEEERIVECIETIRSTYVDDVLAETVALEDVADEHGYGEDVIKKAFNQLEHDGVGEQFYLDDFGLILEIDSSGP